MSIDKFGRRKGAKATPGPKGVGFKLTPDGNYDMEDKILVNIADPVKDADAVNVRSVHSAIASCMRDEDGTFDAHSKKIVNLKDPTSSNDVVNKKYVDGKVPELGKEVWGFKRKRLSNIADPMYDGEAVTLGYIKNNTLLKEKSGYNANNVAITNLGQPLTDGDAINKSYLEKNAILINSRIPRRLTNIDHPEQPNDAINLDFFNNHAMVKSKNQPDWDARWGKIKYLSNPAGPNDAVNKAYLQEDLANLSYAIYSELMSIKNSFNLRIEYSSWMSMAPNHTWGDMFKMHK